VETAPERTRPPTPTPAAHSSTRPDPRAPLPTDIGRRSRAALDRGRVAGELRRLAPVLSVYVGTRLLLIVVALVNGALRHHAFHTELANWDGLWYRLLANHGYPTYVAHARSTLGFFPLYPLAMWVTSHALAVSTDTAGLVLSMVGGLVATVLVERLATGWWDAASGRRAAILFCLFPGSVVFSMSYSEGLLIPLAAGAILALERRRWLVAGALAAFATAAGPSALALVPACAACAAVQLRRHGWRSPDARRSLLAPLLSLVGVSAFASFLWAWTGTPLASLDAQRYGWGERTDPFALVHQLRSLGSQISLAHFDHPTINLNLVAGLLGALVLAVGLVLLARKRGRVSLPAAVWTLGITFLATTSEFVPPNPRMLITAFPAIVVFARYLTGWRYVLLAAVNGGLLALLSALTFVGTTLRP
jgi:hypothetical protein